MGCRSSHSRPNADQAEETAESLFAGGSREHRWPRLSPTGRCRARRRASTHADHTPGSRGTGAGISSRNAFPLHKRLRPRAPRRANLHLPRRSSRRIVSQCSGRCADHRQCRLQCRWTTLLWFRFPSQLHPHRRYDVAGVDSTSGSSKSRYPRQRNRPNRWRACDSVHPRSQHTSNTRRCGIKSSIQGVSPLKSLERQMRSWLSSSSERTLSSSIAGNSSPHAGAN